jgi:transposase
MELNELVNRVLSLDAPWEVVSSELIEGEKRVEIHVSHTDLQAPCPKCARACKKHDSAQRRWRHLDMWDHQTWIVCRVPRVKCEVHGVRTIDVPWADGWARFTAQFECSVIDWLFEASVSAVARNFALTWDQVHGIQSRAVKRGLERRGEVSPSRVGVDETSFQKRHEYVTIVTDLDGSRVLHVADGRGRAALDSFFEDLGPEKTSSIGVIAMDMHAPYIASAADFMDNVTSKICFDRFHVAQLFSKALDKVRRSESKRRAKEGDDSLKGTRYHWLKSMKELPAKMRRELKALLATAEQVGAVWTIKETASNLWHYKSRTWAMKAWVALCQMAYALEIPAVDRVANTIMHHLFGIMNAIVLGETNAAAESVNGRVQALKRRANGYRNRARFRDAIYFHLGGLDLHPRPRFHTNP